MRWPSGIARTPTTIGRSMRCILNFRVVFCFAVLMLVAAGVLARAGAAEFGWFLLLSTMLALLSAGGDAR